MQPTRHRSPRRSAPVSPTIRSKILYALLGIAGCIALAGVLFSPDVNDLASMNLSNSGLDRAIENDQPDAGPKLKVAEIAGKTPAEVEKVLGKPTQTERIEVKRASCPCDKSIYQQGQIEIIYIKGKSDWITVNLPKRQVDLTGPYVVTKAYDNPAFVYVQVATY